MTTKRLNAWLNQEELELKDKLLLYAIMNVHNVFILPVSVHSVNKIVNLIKTIINVLVKKITLKMTKLKIAKSAILNVELAKILPIIVKHANR